MKDSLKVPPPPQIADKSKRITTEIEGHVLKIGINRPEKMNAFDSSMLAELAAAYTLLEDDKDLRCGVLFAHGDHFTAGLDLAEVASHLKAGKKIVPDGMLDPWEVYSERSRTKPMVVAVHGYCLTLGIEMSLAADIVVADRNTKFGQIEIKRGIFPFGGATLRMPARMGWGNAMRYLLTGDYFDGETAYRIGLVQEVTDNGQQLKAALQIARTISEQAPLGVQATLISARKAASQSLPPGTPKDLMEILLPLMESKDAQEGVQSFIERRKAMFTGE